MISFESLRAPKPTPITVVWQGQDLHVTYDRNACTMEITENISFMPIRQRQSKLLLGWDLLKAGVNWQPPDKDDPSWEAVIQDRRVAQALRGRETPLSESEAGELALSPITFEERAAAYEAAWSAILLQLDRDFVRAIDAEILDDFLGVSWRRRISANGSAPIASTDASPGGTST